MTETGFAVIDELIDKARAAAFGDWRLNASARDSSLTGIKVLILFGFDAAC